MRACELITPLALSFTHLRLESEVANTDAQWISSKLTMAPAMLEIDLV